MTAHVLFSWFFALFFTITAQKKVDVSKCVKGMVVNIPPSGTVTFVQVTPISDDLRCSFTISPPQYSRMVSKYAGNLTFSDSITLNQEGGVVQKGALILDGYLEEVDYFDPMDVEIMISLYTNSTIDQFQLNFTAFSIYNAPLEASLDPEVGTIVDTRYFQQGTALRFLCGSIEDCSPRITAVPLVFELALFVNNYNDRCFLDNIYLFVDDVYLGNLASFFRLHKNFVNIQGLPVGAVLTIVRDVDIVDVHFDDNVMLLISAKEAAAQPDNSDDATAPLVITTNMIDKGNMVLNGSDGTIYHFIAGLDSNPFLTSYIVEFVKLERQSSFKVLNVYGNCASDHTSNTLLASITETNKEDWRYLMLRGRCRTFYIKGEVMLQLTGQTGSLLYIGANKLVGANRFGVLVSDNYLSSNNSLLRDSIEITFENGTIGTAMLNWTSTGPDDDVAVTTDKPIQLVSNQNIEVKGKVITISYSLGSQSRGAYIKFQAASGKSSSNPPTVLFMCILPLIYTLRLFYIVFS